MAASVVLLVAAGVVVGNILRALEEGQAAERVILVVAVMAMVVAAAVLVGVTRAAAVTTVTRTRPATATTATATTREGPIPAIQEKAEAIMEQGVRERASR